MCKCGFAALSVCSMHYFQSFPFFIRTIIRGDWTQRLHEPKNPLDKLYIQPVLLKSTRARCPSLCRRMKDRPELWPILPQWAHPNTATTESVTVKGLRGHGESRGWRGIEDNGLGASPGRRGDRRAWTLITCVDFLGCAHVRCSAGIFSCSQPQRN